MVGFRSPNPHPPILPMQARHSLILAAATLALWGCGNGGDSAPPAPPVASAAIDPASGGTVSVTAGPLAGLELVVPPGALAAPASISIREAVAEALIGRDPVGPAAQFSPAGLRFTTPALLRLPFDPLLVGSNTDAEVWVELVDGLDGTISELALDSIDRVAGLVTVEIDHFSTAWVATRAEEFDLGDYLPFVAGSIYRFNDGTSLTIHAPTAVPNLGADRTVFELAGDQGRFGYYLDLSQPGAIAFEGQFAEFFGLGSYQEVHAPALWSPELSFDAEEFNDSWRYTGYVPLGSGSPFAYQGNADLRLFVDVWPQTLQTPAGPFEDVLVLTRETTWVDDDGTSGVSLDEYFLARGVGPVAYALDGASLSLLNTVDFSPPVTTQGR